MKIMNWIGKMDNERIQCYGRNHRKLESIGVRLYYTVTQPDLPVEILAFFSSEIHETR